jgi:hypothetical protein
MGIKIFCLKINTFRALLLGNLAIFIRIFSLNDRTGVECEQGSLLFEVSAFGGYRGLWMAHRLEVAPLLVDYYLKKLEEEKIPL